MMPGIGYKECLNRSKKVKHMPLESSELPMGIQPMPMKITRKSDGGDVDREEILWTKTCRGRAFCMT